MVGTKGIIGQWEIENKKRETVIKKTGRWKEESRLRNSLQLLAQQKLGIVKREEVERNGWDQSKMSLRKIRRSQDGKEKGNG